MTSDSWLMAYGTFPNEESAKKVITFLLESKLIACGNILGPGTSLYFWEGKLQEDKEVYVLMKTKASLFGALLQAFRQQHPYQVPCLLSWTMTETSPEYENFLRESLRREE